MLPEKLKEELSKFVKSGKKLTVLTGAGISAESGIPTYRGVEGYWTKGSRNYTPEEIGTLDLFIREPKEVWEFSLYGRSICHQAKPNKGHYALVELENILQDRFSLITQNVDGLHLRAGNSYERTLTIHGDIEYVRCSGTKQCKDTCYPFPKGIAYKERDEEVTKEDWEKLKCPECGSLLRPNVLWFDEYYTEELYRSDSALRIARETDILIIVGTQGTTNLPNQIFQKIYSKGTPGGIAIVDINMEETFFRKKLKKRKNGFLLEGSSSEFLPKIVEYIKSIS